MFCKKHDKLTSEVAIFVEAPLYFVRSGAINNKLSSFGLYGFYWSSKVYHASESQAFYLSLGNERAGVDAADFYNQRLYAFPLRCLAS